MHREQNIGRADSRGPGASGARPRTIPRKAPSQRPADAPPPEVARPEQGVRAGTSPSYKVLVHNDPVTPMDAVVFVLARVFGKKDREAWRIMREAHEGGLALVEVVALEQAEFHVERAHALARGWSYPLTFTIEPA